MKRKIGWERERVRNWGWKRSEEEKVKYPQSPHNHTPLRPATNSYHQALHPVHPSALHSSWTGGVGGGDHSKWHLPVPLIPFFISWNVKSIQLFLSRKFFFCVNCFNYNWSLFSFKYLPISLLMWKIQIKTLTYLLLYLFSVTYLLLISICLLFVYLLIYLLTHSLTRSFLGLLTYLLWLIHNY